MKEGLQLQNGRKYLKSVLSVGTRWTRDNTLLMMKKRRIYYRRKDKSIIIEGKQDGKSILIWTLPHPEKFISELIEKSSFFTQEKAEKISEKIKRLDYKA